MLKPFLIACSALFLTSFSLPANAALIDNFNVGSGTVLAGPGGSDSDLEMGLGMSTISGERELVLPGTSPISGIGGLTVRANPFGSGFLTFNLDSGTSGSVFLNYNPAGPVDLTDGGVSDLFAFDIITIDQGNVDFTVTLSDSHSSTGSRTLSGAGAGIQLFDFAGFSGGLDFANITDIQLEIVGVNASDLTLDSFSTTSSTPEPSAILIASSLLGACLLRRRLNSRIVSK